MTLKSATQIDDATLVAACLAGDKAAFGVLSVRHRQRVSRLLCRYLDDATAREDVVQEAFLQAYLSLEKLRKPAHFGAWVCGIASNLARMRLRGKVVFEVWEGVEIVVEDSAETTLLQREQARLLHAAIDQLPPSERDAIWHVYLHGYSLKETAAQLAISLSAAKVRVHRGRQRLHHALKPEKPMIPVTLLDLMYFRTHDEPMERTKMSDLATDLVDRMRRMRAGEDVEFPKMATTNIIFLGEQGSERAVPIWIGSAEGPALVVQRPEAEGLLHRPLTANLMQSLLEAGSMQVVRMTVSDLVDKVFIGTLTVDVAGKQHEIDCRPSDGILLAQQVGAPLFVAPKVIDEAGHLPNADGIYPTSND